MDNEFGTLIPEVSLVTNECPEPARWSCYDGTATEVEVLQFLRSLVYMLKPSVVLETGTYLGHGTVHLAQGVSSWGGMVHTAEVDKQCINSAFNLASQHGLLKFINFNHCTGEELIPRLTRIDFAFLDSVFGGPRERELRLVLPKLSRGGVVAVHDTSSLHVANRGPRNYLLAARDELKLQLIMFDTPRGLTLLRKPDLCGDRQ